ncbi:hypothetical protein Fmac_008254 [Flemingia macrophylla]|uniref:TIR domain-containing protein n=1 Tax=Flemingia macrophylla TaxID=520843 RepID=A0ABD1MWY8_9FABA
MLLWCLNELVKILECREKYGHIVIPVFYHVEPTHVRHQSGTYKKAFTEHGKKHKTEVTEAIRSIIIDFKAIKEIKLMHDIFAKMSRLKFIESFGHDYDDIQDITAAEGFQFLISELRYLYWENYPLKSLPGNFLAEKLVILKLIWSRIEKLWDGVKTLPEVPSSLETLNAIGCSSIKALPEVPQSLNTLDVGQCDSLQSLPKLLSSLNTLDVRECRSLQSLPELPMSLETLDVRGCQSLQSLPELPRLLKFLHINWCISLQSLPKLPVSLETLNATGCESLKIVLFPSTIVEQLKENKNRVFFELCSNLDEHSLKAIELNAQLNMVKFAQRRLSAQDDHEAIYAYPGSSVPEWFKYKTTNDYIIIDDISFVASSPVMGFIFCVVFHKHPYLPPHHVYDIEISISGGEGKGNTFKIEHFWVDESDQVYLINNEFCSDFLISSAEDLTRFEIHVTTYRSISGEQCQDLVNGFGVTPISTFTYDNLVQQMELRDSAPSVPKKTGELSRDPGRIQEGFNSASCLNPGKGGVTNLTLWVELHAGTTRLEHLANMFMINLYIAKKHRFKEFNSGVHGRDATDKEHVARMKKKDGILF